MLGLDDEDIEQAGGGGASSSSEMVQLAEVEHAATPSRMHSAGRADPASRRAPLSVGGGYYGTVKDFGADRGASK